MFFDTHCHLNFKTFDDRVGEVVDNAKKAGVDRIVAPGTDIETSKKSVEIAEKHDGIYAAVGIHPHHVFELFKARGHNFLSQRGPYPESEKNFIPSLSLLLKNPKVVAIGEIGIDRHLYQKTKHKYYKVDERFVDLQKEFFIEQIKLAKKYNKALIIHNREAKKDVLEILTVHSSLLTFNSVFHCCEPDVELLEFAKDNKMFIGVDGDVVYWKQKQEFIKKVPLEMLVLETDSPFLSPYRKFPNEPKNIKVIAEFIAKLLNCSIDSLSKQTTENARRLFKI